MVVARAERFQVFINLSNLSSVIFIDVADLSLYGREKITGESWNQGKGFSWKIQNNSCTLTD